MWSTLRSLDSGSSTLENIVQFGSAAVIILEHAFHLWDQQFNAHQESVHPVSVALQQYMVSPNAAAAREALSSVIHTYQAHSRSIAGLIHRSRKKEQFINTVIDVILQHRLHPDSRKSITKLGVELSVWAVTAAFLTGMRRWNDTD
ncbi:hypothetical protein DEU56DRAFT_908677 [Suillus clintonianus]|uniref:uncharacterized protein n=1 Tax=Suillus clintonianus TaxID=1904413 RepID=UPI001B86FD56|nr:uncharacterized protein DEU56DRAFT_908677 [Suillus clintonianus]KAG2150426.1 hypothetical protein DEU56DRAFT_908677 [Suillus clintonianus]